MGRLPPMSRKRLDALDERREVVELVRRRDRTCRATHAPGPCGGPLDAHEVVSRAVWSGSWLEERAIVLLCRRHHEMVTDWTVLGQALGLVVPRWAFDRYGLDAIVGPGPWWMDAEARYLAETQAHRLGFNSWRCPPAQPVPSAHMDD